MAVALSHRGLLTQRRIGKQQYEFAKQLRDLVRDQRYIYLPLISDALVSLDQSGYDAPITQQTKTAAGSRTTVLGRSLQVAYDGSTDWASSPANARYSFNLAGLTDLPFSVFGVYNVTNTANAKTILCKWNSGGTLREWQVTVDATNHLGIFLDDLSVPVVPSCFTTAAVPNLGVPHSFAVTYSGLGGATAMNGVTVYQDGVSLAVTRTNQATYVAMESQAQTLQLGSVVGGLNWWQGTLAMVGLCGVALSQAEISDLHALCKDFYGI